MYRSAGIALIEKTPEPFRVTRRLSDRRFEGHFASRAQPDFKGTLTGGSAVVFDAKYTDGYRIALSRLSGEQREALLLHQRLGAAAGILAGFGGDGRIMGAWIPIDVFWTRKRKTGICTGRGKMRSRGRYRSSKES